MPSFTEDPVIKRFLAWDTNLRLSDKVRSAPALPSILGQGRAFRAHGSLSSLMPCHPFPSGTEGFPAVWTAALPQPWLLWDLAPVALATSSALFSLPLGTALCSSLSKTLLELAVLSTRPETSALATGSISQSLIPLFLLFHNGSPFMFVLFPSVSPVHGGSLFQPRGPLLLAVPTHSFLPGSVSILLIPISQYSYPGEEEGDELYL